MNGDTRCASKKHYRSEATARTILRRMRRHVIDWSRLRVYRCEVHQCWHIGTVRPKQLSALLEGGGR